MYFYEEKKIYVYICLYNVLKLTCMTYTNMEDLRNLSSMVEQAYLCICMNLPANHVLFSIHLALKCIKAPDLGDPAKV